MPVQIAPRSSAFIILLGVLAALPALSIDISAPTLLLLPVALNTTTFTAGLTLSLFMLGFAAGQVVGGRVSDQRGRRPALLAGLACFAAAGLACAIAPSAPALVCFRLVQGVGAGICAVLSFAVIQDVFQGAEARTRRSQVTVVVGLAPLVAPALGSALVLLAGWRSVHSVLAIAGCALLAVCWLAVRETLPARTPPSDSRAFQAAAAADPAVARETWLERGFIGTSIANALSYGCVFAYIAGSPVVIMGQLGYSPGVFAGVFAATAASLTAGAWTSGRLSQRGIRTSSLLLPSLAISACAALLGAAACLTGLVSGAVLIPLLIVVMFARGVIAPNLQHLAIERRRGQAGSASAVVGVLQLTTGAAASAVVAALLPHLGSSAVFVPMAVLTASALMVWLWADAAGPARPVDQGIQQPGWRVAAVPLQGQKAGGGNDTPLDVAEALSTAFSRLEPPGLRGTVAVLGGAIAGTAASRDEMDYVIEGNLQVTGGAICAAVTVSDAVLDGEAIWTGTFQAEPAGIAVLPSRIATETVAQLTPYLLLGAAPTSPRNSQAVVVERAVLTAKTWIMQLNRPKLLRARVLLDQAIERDPDCAAAHTWLAYWSILAVALGWATDPKTLIASAAASADRAIELGPRDAQALAIAGHVKGYLLHDVPSALALHARALELDPQLPIGWALSSWSKIYSGDHSTAIQHALTAESLSPSDPHIFITRHAMMTAHLFQRQLEQAETVAAQTLTSHPGHMPALNILLGVLGHMGRRDKAAECLAEIRKLDADVSVSKLAARAPFRPADRAFFIEGLRCAGVPG